MFRKHKEKLNQPMIRTLNFSSFILGVSAALILYLESDYFKTAASSDNVTVYFVLAYSIALLLIFNWHRLIERFGKRDVFLATLLIEAFFVFMLSILPIGSLGIIFLIGYIFIVSLTWIDIDILLESGSRDHKTGRIRGAYLTIVNAGYLIAPAFAGFVIQNWGFQPVFSVAAVLILFVWSISFWKIWDVDNVPPEKTRFWSLLEKTWERKNVMRIYYVSFVLEFFYALMIIYTPLHLLELGFSWTDIGQIFTIMLIPFVLFQYPAGYLADKKFEEGNMIIFSLFIMAVSTASLFFISSKSFFLWAGLLFCTRIGASLVEVLRDSYFYKRIDCSDVDIIDFFRSVRPLGNILGPLIAMPLIFLFQIKFVFLLVAVVVFSGIFAASKMNSSRHSHPAKNRICQH